MSKQNNNCAARVKVSGDHEATKPTSMPNHRAKAITLVRMNRRKSPSGQLEDQLKELVASLPQLDLRSIKRSLENHFDSLIVRKPAPESSFSFDLYTAFEKRHRNRMSLAAYILQQVAAHCIPNAVVDHEEFERSFCEGAPYFKPTADCVIVRFPVVWECDPTNLEKQFNLPAGDAQHVLSVLEDPRASQSSLSFIQIIGLARPYGPYAAPRWPATPLHITPAARALKFFELLHPYSRYGQRRPAGHWDIRLQEDEPPAEMADHP